MAIDYNSFVSKTYGSGIDLDKFLGTGASSYFSAQAAQEYQAQQLQAAQQKIKDQLGDNPDRNNPVNKFAFFVGSELGQAWKNTTNFVENKVGQITGGVKNIINNPSTIENYIPDLISGASTLTESPIQTVGKIGSGYVTDKMITEPVKQATQNILGKPYDLYQWNQIKNTIPQEQRNLVNATIGENITEKLANIATAPVRFTAGSLATLASSYAMEHADYNGKYTPQTDAEKLLIGPDDIQRLTKQQDLYGTIARGLGVPAALTVGAILENPFLLGTGVSGTVKSALKDAFAKQAEKDISKIGFKEFINLIDNSVQKKVLSGDISKDAAEEIMRDVTSVRLLPAPKTKITGGSNVATKDLGNIELPSPEIMNNRLLPEKSVVPTNVGEGFTMTNTTEADVKGSKLYNRASKAMQKFNDNPTSDNLDNALKTRDNYRAYLDSKNNIPEVKPTTVTPKVTQEGKITTPEVKTVKPEVSPVTPGVKTTTPGEFIPKQIQDIANDAVNKLDTEFPDLPTMSRVSKEQQQKAVADLWQTDSQRMINIATGKENVKSGDPLPESIYLFVKDYANKTKDVDLIKDLATSDKGVAYQSSQIAQRLSMLNEGRGAEDLSGDSVKNMRILSQVKNSAAKKQFGDIGAATDKTINDMTSAINKTVSNKDDWQSFIDSITC